jgi:two-component system, chemotaxis family, response regulator Rcp1
MRNETPVLLSTPGHFHAGTMLLVEDNPADVRLLEEALSECHLSPKLVVVTDGEEAIRYVEDIDREGKASPDLFVLDLNLPKRSGLEVLSKIRSSRNCRETPVVILSSQDSSRDRAEAERLGASAYLKKTPDIRGLVEIGGKLQALLNPHLPGTAPNMI